MRLKFVRHHFFGIWEDIHIVEENTPFFLFRILSTITNFRKNRKKKTNYVQILINDSLGPKSKKLIINDWLHDGNLEISMLKADNLDASRDLSKLDLYELTKKAKDYLNIDIVFRAGKRKKFPLSNLYYYLS